MNYAGKFGPGGLVSNAHGVDIDSLSHRGHSADAITVPDAHLLFSGDFHRAGSDLIISDDLHRVVVPNYFHGAKRPTLFSPEGAPLDPAVIEALTGHTAYAQAGNPPAAKVVGHVAKMTGSASIVRNGVTIDVQTGDAVYQTDVVQTGSGSSLGLVLDDGTTFNLSANARLMLNDLTFDASSTSNSSFITLVEGAANFVAGQIARTGDMKVATPVAVIGIRGTAVKLEIAAADGKVDVSVIDQRDGQVHSVQVFKCVPTGVTDPQTGATCSAGDAIGTVSSNGPSLSLTPTTGVDVTVQAISKTPAQVAQEFSAFQATIDTYNIQKQINPNLPQHTENGGNNNANPQQTRNASLGSTPPDPPPTDPRAESTSTDRAVQILIAESVVPSTDLAVTSLGAIAPTTSSSTVNATSLPVSLPPSTTAPAITAKLTFSAGTSSSDNITSNDALSGTGLANTAVYFTIDGTPTASTVMTDANGTWSFTPSGLADGVHTIVASQTDTLGYTGTVSLSFTLDTTAPSGGTPSPVVAFSNTDNITAATAPTFTVALSPSVAVGDKVQLFLDGSPLVHGVTHVITTADVTAGVVDLTVTAGDLGADGSKQVTAQFSDAAGNSSTTSALSFTLDTTAPTVTINGTGGNTNQSAQPISGTVDIGDAGATVDIYDNSGTTPVATAVVQSDGTWSKSVPLVSGTNSLTAQVTDGAGNTGTSNSVVFTLNAVGPTGGTPVLAPSSDSGVSNSDDITNVTAPTFTVALNTSTVVVGDTVELLLGGSPLAQPVVHVVTSVDITNGSVSLAVPAGDLGIDGSKSISAQLSDSFGNSNTTAALVITLDTTAPTVTTLTDVTSNGSDLDAGQTVTFTLTASEPLTVAAGAALTLSNGATAAYNSGTGKFVYTVAAGQDTSDLNVTGYNGSISDAAGNALVIGGVTLDTHVQIDTTAPTVTTLTDVTSNGSDLDAGQTVTFTLTASEPLTVAAGAALTLSNGATAAYNSGTGKFVYTVAAGQDTSDLNVTGYNGSISDAAGNALVIGGVTLDTHVQIDTTAPTVTINGTGGNTNQSAQPISGTVDIGDAGATVDIYDNSGTTPVATAVVQSDGTWSKSVPLVSGTNSLTAQVTDGAGNTGTSNSVVFTLNAVGPTGGTPVLAPSSDSGVSNSDDITNVTAPTFTVALNTSTVVVGDTVELLLGGSPLAQPVVHVVTSVDITNGSVSLAVPAGDLGIDGSKSISAQLSDSFGNSNTTAALVITLDTTAPTVTTLTDVTSNGSDLDAGQTVTFTLTASEPLTVAAGAALTLSNGATAAYNSGTGKFVYTVAAGQDTSDLNVTGYSGSISDAAGNALVIGGVTLDTHVQIDTTAPTVTTLTDVTSNGSDLDAGQTVTFTLTASEPLTVAAGAALTLSNGATAAYNSGTGKFVYTVAAGQDTSDLNVTGYNGSISDAAGNALVIGGVTLDTHVQIDTTAPTVTTLTDATSNGSDLDAGQTVTFTLTASEPLTVAAGAALTLSNGATAAYNSGTGKFVYTVAAGQDTSDLNVTGYNGSISDAAGNALVIGGVTLDTHVQIDTTAPTGGTPALTAASDSGSSSTDNITDITSPTFTVALNPTVAVGDMVQLLLNGSPLAHNVTHTITATDILNGSVSLTVTSGDLGADGSKSIAAKFTDTAGNSSTTSADVITLDTTAPTGATPALTAASDSGSSSTDNITDITSPTFTVALNPTVAVGDAVQLLLGGSPLAHNVTHTITATDILNGSVSLTVTSGDLGPDGSKSIAAKFTDTAGNSSTTSADVITLDTTAPTGGTPALAAASDSGSSSTDNITDITSPTFTVALNPTVAVGDAVQLLLGGSPLAHNVTHTITGTDILDGSVSLTVTSGDLGPDGSKSIAAKFTDTAGNSSTTSADVITLDTTAPTGGTPALAAASDSGSSSVDNITDITSPTFTVALNPTVAVGDTVQLLLGGSPLAHNVTHTITGTDILDGSVSLTVTSGDLGPDGSKSIAAKFTDTAGNTSTTSADVITLDTTAPVVTINGTGGNTNQSAQTISGTGEVGATVNVYDNNNFATPVATTTILGDGSWSTSVSLVSGNNSLIAKATDAAGNNGSSNTVQFTLNATGPTGGTPVMASSSDSGVSNGDDITNVTAPTFTVALGATVVAGDTVQLLLNGLPLAHNVTQTITSTDVSNGLVSLTVTSGDLGIDGSKSISAQLSDSFGNSNTTAGLIITLDTTAPTSVAAVTALSSDTGSSNSDFVTSTSSQTVSGTYTGTLGTGETIQVSADGGTTWVTASASSGTWSASGVTLSAGTGSLSVRSIDLAGNATAGTGHSYTLDQTAPTSVAAVTALSSDTGSSNSDFVTSTSSQTVGGTYTGTLGTGETIQVSADGGTTWVTASASSGTWSASGVTLSAGTGTLSVRSIDLAGNVTAGTGHSYTLDQTAPTSVAAVTALSSDTGSSNSDFVTSTSSQTVSGTYTGTLGTGETIQVSADGGTTWVTASASSGTWSASGVTLSAGTGSLSVRSIDLAGNATAGTGHSYTLDQTAPSAVATVTALSSDTGSSNSDFVTSTSSQTVGGTYTGTLGTGETIQVSADGGTTWVTASASSGTWSASGVTLSAGTGSLSVRSIDLAGNVTAGTGHSYTLDQNAPTSVAAVTALSSDTGSSNSDFVTSTSSQTVGGTYTGTLGTGETIQVSADGGTTWVTASASSGTWSASGVTLSAGTGSLSVRSIDLAGNATAGTGHSYTLDQTAPTSVAAVTALSSDTGSSNSDFVTSTSSQTVSGTYTGTLGTGETIQVSADGGTTWVTASASSGTWSASGVTLSAGTGSLSVRSIDLAGNATAGTGHSYTLDQTAPSAVATVTALSSDTGSSNSDFVTSTSSQTVGGTYTGTLGTGETIQVSADGGTTWVTASASSGTWSASGVTLSAGTGTLSVRSIDLAGNVTAGTGHSYTLDQTAPSVAITTSGGTTSQAAQTISGTGEVGATVNVYDNNNFTTPVATTTVLSDSSWSANVSLVSGSNSLVAKATDVAGNTGTSNTILFTLPTFTVQWVGANNGSWGTAGNWTPANVPGPSDDVLIGVAENVISTGSVTIDALFSTAGSTVTVSAGTFTVNNSSSISSLQGTLALSGGTLTPNAQMSIANLSQSGGLLTTGTVTVTGSAQLSGGRESGAGTTTITGGATFTTTNFQLDGGHTLKLGGSSAATGTNVSINLNGTVGDLGSGILTILAGATFDDQTTAASGNGLNISASNFSGDNGSDAIVNNFGTFKKSGTATTSTISTTFSSAGSATPNSGTVNVQNGTLILSGGGTDTQASYIGTGTIQFGNGAGGIRTMDGASSISTANATFGGGTTTLSGNYNVAGTTTVSGGTAILQGTISNLGSSLVISNGTLNLGGLSVSTGVLTLSQSGGLLTTGTVTVTGSAQLSGGRESGAGTTTITGGATFTTTNFQLDGGHTLKLGGSSAATGTNVSINLNGTVGDLGSGILTILAGATFDDQTTAASGNGLNISASNFSGDNGSDAIVNNFGTFKKSGTATTSTISTTFSSAGSATPNSGTVNVQNGTLILSGGGTDTQASYIGTGTIQFGNGAGGIRTMDGASSISTANATFGGGTTTLSGNYNVAGTTTVSGGTAILQGTISNLGSSLVISNGTLNLGGLSVSTGVLTLSQSGGLLTTGTVTVTGSAQLSGGRESGAGTTTITGGATFTTTNFQLDGGHTLKLGGSSAATGTNVSINLNGTVGDLGSGILTILAGATFDDQTTAASGNGLNISASNFSGDNGSDAIVNNFGTFKKSGTATTSTISTTFSSAGSATPNSGTVNVQNGTLILSGGGTDTQASYIGTGTIQFGNGAGGIRTMDGASSISTANATFGGGTTTLSGNYNVAGTTTVSGGTAILQGTISNLGSSLVISNGTLNLGGLSVSTGVLTLSQSGGLLTTGTVTVTGSAQLSGGRESGAGTTTITGGATFTTTNFQLDGGHTLKLGGSSAATGTNVSINLNGTVGDLGSGILTILAGATFDDQTTAASGNGLNISASNFSGDNGSDAIVNNFGTFKKSGTATTSTISTTFSSAGSATPNSGTVNVQNGTLILSGGGTDTQASYIGTGTIQFGNGAGGIRTMDGASSISTANATFGGGTTTLSGNYNVAGTTTVSGGTAILQGTISNLGSSLVISNGTLNLGGLSVSTGVLTLSQSGGLLTTGTVTVTGSAQLSGGRESGAGTTTITGGATFTTTNFQLDGGHTLKLGGSSAATGTNVSINLNGTVGDLGSGILTILAGATFDDQTTAASGNGLNISASNFSGDNGSDAIVNNFGTFKKSGTATTSTISTRFNNTGTVNVQAGTLALSGGGVLSGTFSLAVGTFIQFNAGYALNGSATFAGGTISGSGTLAIGSGADVQFSSSVAGPTISFADATGELILANPSTFQSTISGLAVGDTIDLINVQVASATINGSTLNITETNNQTLSYHISGAITGTSFSVLSGLTDSKLVLESDTGISGNIAAGSLSFAPASTQLYQFTGAQISGGVGNGLLVQSTDTNPADIITVQFDAASSISVTGSNFNGIDITTSGAGISISTAASINAAQYGILASVTGAGSINISNSGQIEAGATGINANNQASSLPQTGGVTTSSISVTASGTINSGPLFNANGTQPAGILAGYKGGTSNTINPSVFGNVSIDNFANIIASGGDGIRGYNYGTGRVTITDEANTTIVAPGEFGIRGINFGTGNVSIVTSSGDSISSGASGISAINQATTIGSSAGSLVSVVAHGAINSGTKLNPSGSQPQGISAGYFGANGTTNNAINGTVSVDDFANVTAAAGYGINAFNWGNGSVTLTGESGTTVSGAQYGIGAYSLGTAGPATATTDGATLTSSPTLNFASTPSWIAAGMTVFDVTTGKSIGTVASTTGTTVTLTANAANAVGSGNLLSFPTIAITSAATSTSSATLNFTSTPAWITGAMTVYDATTGQSIGTVASTTATTATLTANASSAVNSGDTLSFGDLTVDVLGNATISTGTLYGLWGIQANTNNGSNMSVTTSPADVINSAGFGIDASSNTTSASSASRIFVTAYGTINSGFDMGTGGGMPAGIRAGYNGSPGNAALAGSVSIDDFAIVNAADNFGVQEFTYGIGNVSLILETSSVTDAPFQAVTVFAQGGGNVSVVSRGTITSTTGTGIAVGTGNSLSGAGSGTISMTNAATGVVQALGASFNAGAITGVVQINNSTTQASTFTNSGTVSSILYSAGSPLNWAISSYYGGNSANNGAVTVTNSGVISGNVFLNTAPTGSSFFQNQTGGIWNILGQNFFNGTGTITNAGTINIAGPSQINSGGVLSITNNGFFEIASIAMASIAGSVSGTGRFDIGAQASLEFVGAVGSGQTVSFDGEQGQLILDQPSTFSATILGAVPGDIIEANGAYTPPPGFSNLSGNLWLMLPTSTPTTLSGPLGPQSLNLTTAQFVQLSGAVISSSTAIGLNIFGGDSNPADTLFTEINQSSSISVTGAFTGASLTTAGANIAVFNAGSISSTGAAGLSTSSGAGSTTIYDYGNISSVTGIRAFTGGTAYTSAATSTASNTLNFTTTPGWIVPGLAVYDETNGKSIGTVQSITASTVTLTGNAANAVGSGDTLLFGAPTAITNGTTSIQSNVLSFASTPSWIVPGAAVYDETSGAIIGTVSSTTPTAVTLAADAVNPVGSGDTLAFTGPLSIVVGETATISGPTAITNAPTTTASSTLSFASALPWVATGMTAYDMTTGQSIGAVSGTAGNTVTLTASAANAVNSGDLISFLTAGSQGIVAVTSSGSASVNTGSLVNIIAGNTGINVQNQGKLVAASALTVVAGGTITSGLVSGSEPAAIQVGYFGGTSTPSSIPNPPLSGIFGNVTIDSTATIRAYTGFGINAFNYGTGDISVSNSGTITATAAGNTNGVANPTTGLYNPTTAQVGINLVNYGDGNITLVTSGAITSGSAGIFASNAAVGAQTTPVGTQAAPVTVTVVANGPITSGPYLPNSGNAPGGILVNIDPGNILGYNGFVYGDLLVSASGSSIIAQAGDGIRAINHAQGNVTVDLGNNESITALNTPTGASGNLAPYGIALIADGPGDLTVATSNGDVITSGSTGINATQAATAIAASADDIVAINAAGTINAGNIQNDSGGTPAAISAGFYNGGAALPNVNGSVIINSSATVIGASRGLSGYNYGNGDVTINDSGNVTVTSDNVRANSTTTTTTQVAEYGIEAATWAEGAGNVAVNVYSGAISVTATPSGTSAAATATSSATLSFVSTPSGIAAGMIAYDVTTGHAVGTVSSSTGTTVTLAANAVAAVASGDMLSFTASITGSAAAATSTSSPTLSFTSTPAAIAVGMTVYDLTTGLAVGSVSSITATTVTLGTNAASAVASGDTLSFSTPVKNPVYAIFAENNDSGNISVITNAGTSIYSSGVGINVVNEGSPIAIATATAATNGATATTSHTLSFGSTPTWISAGNPVYDVTTGTAIGTVSSTSATTVTLTANAANAVGQGDTLSFSQLATATAATPISSSTLSFGSTPAWIVPGMTVYDITTGQTIGAVLSTTGTTVTLAANAAHPVGNGDALSFPEIATATAATSTSSQTLNFALTPSWAAPGMTVYDDTTGTVVGTVSSTTGTTVALGANASNPVASGDVLSFALSSIVVTSYSNITSGSVLTGTNAPPAGIIAGYLGGDALPAVFPVTGADGEVTVNNFGNITAAAGDGIRAYTYGIGNVTVNENAGTITALGGSSPTNGYGDGINANNFGPGSILVTTAAGVTINSGSSGISALNHAPYTGSSLVVPSTSQITVIAYGTIESGTIPTQTGDPAAGILAGYEPGVEYIPGGPTNTTAVVNANVAGNVLIDDYASITAAAGTDGIRGFNYGTGSVAIFTETGATITGGRYGIAGFTYGGGNVSITNYASVSGGTAAIDAQASGAGSLTIANYGTINGTVVSDATTAFQNEGGAIFNASSSSTFDGVSFANQGTINVTNGATLTISAASYTDTGSLIANGGNVTVTVAETGGGSATIYGTSQIEYDGASSENITFAAGATGELVLLDSSTFAGMITGFTGTGAGAATSDKLDLADINFLSPQFSKSYANNVLTVTDGTHTANLKFVGTYTLANFSFATDGSNGTLVTDPPAGFGQGDPTAADASSTTIINDGAVIERATPSTDKIIFAGAVGKLVLDQPTSFEGHIDGISGPGDIINLKNFDAAHTTAAAAFNPLNDTTVLTLTNAPDHVAVSLTLEGNYTSFGFNVTADPNGGVDVAAMPGVSIVANGETLVGGTGTNITWNHQAPVIVTNNLTTVQNGDGSTTVLGLQVTDSDNSASTETFNLTATTGGAASGTSITPSSDSGSLSHINSDFTTGVTYHLGGTPPETDKVTLTVTDSFGASDTVNFVFNQAGSGPNITLQGTSGKDVIFATSSQDVLTGGAGQDQFLFAPTSSGPSVQHTITDFEAGIDKLDVRLFGGFSAASVPGALQQQGSDTLITLDAHDTLLLKNVFAASVHASDFIVHA